MKGQNTLLAGVRKLRARYHGALSRANLGSTQRVLMARLVWNLSLGPPGFDSAISKVALKCRCRADGRNEGDVAVGT